MSGLLPLIGPTASVVAIVLSVISLVRSSPSAQLGRERQAQMRIVASRTLILWEQIRTVLFAVSKGASIDAYVFPAMRVNSRRLEDALDKAIGLGLWKTIVSQRPHAVILYGAFGQSLAYAASVEATDTDPWIKQHLLMGMSRLLEACETYTRTHGDPLAQVLAAATSRELAHEAWTYMSDKVSA